MLQRWISLVLAVATTRTIRQDLKRIEGLYGLKIFRQHTRLLRSGSFIDGRLTASGRSATRCIYCPRHRRGQCGWRSGRRSGSVARLHHSLGIGSAFSRVI
ncbi:uncharacterized protein B0I36DRAFT_340630 [Microdochium trichocladiopsis]|uniref:Uncharacterized protein n=1 Tax=Microdochium trichocladiopsis TaxID=1682393 RepID=A0A9P9BII0_9PEZI|nr:uncharacterized protein B0I36DRAFT_340630 [Microdochium trichocladiopsis]KAH7012182.1 hypothetical protein B0I36DRAFT_340630 [Microdochium trichocladiopsis]